MSWIDQRPDDAMDGAFTAVGPVPVETVEPAEFRDAMSRLGAAVHVVTTSGPAGKTGFTATAVCSISDQPATLLVSLNRRSQITPVLHANGVFCVNTLRAEEETLADVFAGRTGLFMEDRFKSGAWTTLKSGSPVLTSSVVALDCRIIEVKAVATHNLFIAAVEGVWKGPSGPALVYHERAYKSV
ncbi:MAG TPA: flavin reductase [Xanthobacteraceae bacterium]|jgi:flavin reductase (DIM6/NTAB) family NADH-FMN oxidoreductase RutF|nr:flavin reductase [Xanthobacteraceae bacterium]